MENQNPQTDTVSSMISNIPTDSPSTTPKNSNSKLTILVIGMLIILLVYVSYLNIKKFSAKQSLINTQTTLSSESIANFKEEFIIYHKVGYIWKSDLSGNNPVKIIAYPQPSGESPIMWDISPDNKNLLISIPNKGLLEINLATDAARTIDPTGGYGLYSPDGKYIYYIGNKKMIGKGAKGNEFWTQDRIVANRDGTEKIVLPDDVQDNLSPQAWSPDGKYIVFFNVNEYGYEAISRINVQTKGIDQLYKVPESEDPNSYIQFFSPSWSPDGSTICSFTGYNPTDKNNPDNTINASYVSVVDIATKTAKRTGTLGYGDNSFCYWAPNSQEFAILAGDAQVNIYDKNATLVEKIKVPGSIMMDSGDSWKEISWSPDSSKIIVNASNTLLLIDLHSNTYQKIMSGVTQTNFSTYWSK